MASKEKELRTLEAIKKLVADLGEDSYIGFAFEGCFEVAEENIRNDFACNAMDRAAGRAKDAAMKVLAEERAAAKKAADEANDQIRFLNVQYTDAKEMWNKQLQEETKKTAACKKEADEIQGALNERIVENAKLQKALDEKDIEIMKLKAKLYDMMNA